ncbi:sterol desaturase family protein [Phragmitibacter flavus]|uniref:Sterol desaturase family protein n=2 Tax=Phragmitibacter flavus TaxID=2576071 RepID=A0A5R8K8D2_9BACT|nr:sterol desaturase family protein [Phragmitibacter flavus]
MRSETSRSPNANPNRPRATAKRLRAIPRNWLQSTTALGIRYALFAGSAWLLGYVLFKNRWLHRKVIPAFPASKNVRREMLYSVRTVIIFGLVGALTLFAVRQGWTQMYKNISDYGNLWFALSIILGILLHDAYFYWTHRLMHHRRLFKIFHRGHHLSTNPIPWAAYAFDPLEALVHAMIFPIIAFAFPIHPVAFGLIMLWQITFNVVGHTGYEFHPRWLMDSWLGKFMNTPTNHAMHHETMRGNFGLYFNLWDRLMGTNHQDYETRFREVTQRKPSPLSYSPLALPLNSDPAIEAKSDATTT